MRPPGKVLHPGAFTSRVCVDMMTNITVVCQVIRLVGPPGLAVAVDVDVTGRPGWSVAMNPIKMIRLVDNWTPGHGPPLAAPRRAGRSRLRSGLRPSRSTRRRALRFLIPRRPLRRSPAQRLVRLLPGRVTRPERARRCAAPSTSATSPTSPMPPHSSGWRRASSPSNLAPTSN